MIWVTYMGPRPNYQLVPTDRACGSTRLDSLPISTLRAPVVPWDAQPRRSWFWRPSCRLVVDLVDPRSTPPQRLQTTHPHAFFHVGDYNPSNASMVQVSDHSPCRFRLQRIILLGTMRTCVDARHVSWNPQMWKHYVRKGCGESTYTYTCRLRMHWIRPRWGL